MFEAMKEFSNIVVSGPQRSGTRIAAKIIAHDLDKAYVDEADLNFHDFRLLDWHLNKGNVVIQCPGLCHMLHYITRKDTLVVVVYRNIEDIMLSEAKKWDKQSMRLELVKYGCCSGVISTIKYNFWETYQRPILENRARNINYNQLENHSMFINNREKFLWNQTHHGSSN